LSERAQKGENMRKLVSYDSPRFHCSVASRGQATAPELKVLCVDALRSALEELAPAFEKSSGHSGRRNADQPGSIPFAFKTALASGVARKSMNALATNG
jgi:hypothetical protein